MIIVSVLLLKTWNVHEGTFKGTVSVTSSDLTFKDDNALFTAVPFKALACKLWNRYQCACGFST